MSNRIFYLLIIAPIILLSYNLKAQPLSLISPQNQLITAQNSVLFSWNGITGSTSYDLQISNDAEFTSIAQNITAIAGTSKLVSVLNMNQTYFWRIRSFNGSTYTQWSNSREFTSFDPSSIPGIAFWLKSDAGIIKDASDNIDSWTDQTSNNYVVSQTGASRPTQVSNILNGYPAIRFNNNELDFLNGGDILDLKTNSRSTFIVGLSKNFTSSYLFKGTWENSRYGLTYHTDNFAAFYEEGIADFRVKYLSPGTSINRYQVITNVIDRSEKKHELYFNQKKVGTPINSSAMNPAFNWNNTDDFLIGAMNIPGGQQWHFNGDMFEIIITNNAVSDEQQKVIENYLHYKYAPPVNLGPDINVSNNFCDTAIDAGKGFLSYLWSTGDTARIIRTNKADIYSVKVFDIFGVESRDTIYVNYPTPIAFDSTICQGSSIVLNSKIGAGFNYNWSNNLHSETISINSPGNYLLTITDYKGCSIVTDTFRITNPSADIQLLSSCFGDPTNFSTNLTLGSGDTPVSYLWNFGDSKTSTSPTPQHTYTSPGEYTITLKVTTTKGCTINSQKTIKIVATAPLPEKFELATPKNNEYIPDANITFSWTSGANTLYYKIQYARDSLFTLNSNIIPGTITNTTFTTATIPTGYSYFWRVLAYNSCKDSIISEASKFTLFKPSLFGNLQVWLRADKDVQSTSNNVLAWNDQTNNHFDAEQSNSENQPLLVPNSLNNKPVIHFDGTTDYLSFGLTLDNVLAPGLPITLFIVQKANNASYGTLISNGDIDPPFQGMSLYSGNSTISNIRLFEMIGETGEHKIDGVLGGNYQVNTLIYSGNKSLTQTDKILKNGLTLSKSTIASNSPISTANINTPCQIGARDGAYSCLNGDIAEILIFSTTLTESNRVTIEKYLLSKYKSPPVNLGPDITIPYGLCDTSLDAGLGYIKYIWSTNETSRSINIKNGGKYWVKATDPFGFVTSDTIIVNKPSITLKDTAYCLNSNITLSIDLGPHYSYLWKNGSTNKTFMESTAEDLWFSISDTLGCYYKDTIKVSTDNFEIEASLGIDRNACDGDTLRLIVGHDPRYIYNWSNNTNLSHIIPHYPGGNYHVTVTNQHNCTAKDTIALNIVGYAPTILCSASSVCLKNSTYFEDNSYITPIGSIESRRWDFGDGDSSSLQNPNHTYADSGLYIATLTLNTSAGCNSTVKIPTRVYPLPIANFNPGFSCAGQEIQFIDLSKPIYGSIDWWKWDFGNGNTSTIPQPKHILSQTGKQPISLIVSTNNGCLDTISRTFFVKESPKVDFGFNDICFGQDVNFWDLSEGSTIYPLISWNWDFGDSTYSNSQTPTHFYKTHGQYNVSLSVKSLSGCEINVKKALMVHAMPNVNINSDNLICSGNTTNLIDISTTVTDSIDFRKWRIDSLGTFFDKELYLTFNKPGKYNASLIAKTTGNCIDSTSQSLIVNASPTAKFDFYPQDGTSPITINFKNQSTDATLYTWDFNDLTEVVTEKEPIHLFDKNGTYHFKLIVENKFGCIDSTSHTIKIMPTQNDLAIVAIQKINQDNYTKLSIDIANLGTTVIHDMELQMEIEGGTTIQEIWHGRLEAGQFITYTFNASFVLNSNLDADFLCARIVNPNGNLDNDITNNEDCVTLQDEFSTKAPYPNPTNTSFTIEAIIPFKDMTEICLYSIDGNKVANLYSDFVEKGFNKMTFSCENITPGMYAIRYIYREQTQIQIIIVK